MLLEGTWLLVLIFVMSVRIKSVLHSLFWLGLYPGFSHKIASNKGQKQKAGVHRDLFVIDILIHFQAGVPYFYCNVVFNVLILFFPFSIFFSEV